MPNPTKRHYRAAQREKELENEYAMMDEETIKSISIIGMLMYIMSIFTAFILGYVIGRES